MTDKQIYESRYLREPCAHAEKDLDPTLAAYLKELRHRLIVLAVTATRGVSKDRLPASYLREVTQVWKTKNGTIHGGYALWLGKRKRAVYVFDKYVQLGEPGDPIAERLYGSIDGILPFLLLPPANPKNPRLVYALRAPDPAAEAHLAAYQRLHLDELRRRFLTQSIVASKASALYNWLQTYAGQFTKLMFRDATDSYAFWAEKADQFVFIGREGLISYGPQGTFAPLSILMESVEGLLELLFEQVPGAEKEPAPKPKPRLSRIELAAFKEIQRRFQIPFSDESASWVSQLSPFVWEIRKLNDTFYLMLGDHQGRERVCLLRPNRIEYDVDHGRVPLRALNPDTQDFSKLIPHLFGPYAAPLADASDSKTTEELPVQGKASETPKEPLTTSSPVDTVNATAPETPKHPDAYWRERLIELFTTHSAVGGGWKREREQYITQAFYLERTQAFLIVLHPPHSGRVLATFAENLLDFRTLSEPYQAAEDAIDLTHLFALASPAPVSSRARPGAGALVNPPEPLPEGSELGPNPCAEHAVRPMEVCVLGRPAWMDQPKALNKDQNWYLFHLEKALKVVEEEPTIHRYLFEMAMLGYGTRLFQTSFSNSAEGPNGWFLVVDGPYQMVINFAEDFVNRLPLFGFLEEAEKSGKHHDMTYLLPHVRANRLARLRTLDEGTKTFPERLSELATRSTVSKLFAEGVANGTIGPETGPQPIAFGQPWEEDPETFNAAEHPYTKLMHEKALRHPWLQVGSRSTLETQIVSHRSQLAAKALSAADASQVVDLQLVLEEFRARINRELGASGGSDGAALSISEVRESEGKVMFRIHRSDGPFAFFARCSRYEKASFPGRLHNVWNEAKDLSHLLRHLYGVESPTDRDYNAGIDLSVQGLGLGTDLGPDGYFDFSGVQSGNGRLSQADDADFPSQRFGPASALPKEIHLEELTKLQTAITGFLNPTDRPPLGNLCVLELYELEGSFHFYLALPGEGTAIREERSYLVLHPGLGLSYPPVSNFPRLRAVGRDFGPAIDLLKGVENARNLPSTPPAPMDAAPLGEDLTPLTSANTSGNGFDVETAGPAPTEPRWGDYGFTSWHQSHFPELRRRLERFKASDQLFTVAYRILQVHHVGGEYHVMVELPSRDRRNVVLQEHGQHLAPFASHGVLGNALDLSNLLPYLGAEVPAKPLPVIEPDQAAMERDQEKERLVEEIERAMPQLQEALEDAKDWLRKHPQLFVTPNQTGLDKQREKDGLEALIKFYRLVQYGA